MQKKISAQSVRTTLTVITTICIDFIYAKWRIASTLSLIC